MHSHVYDWSRDLFSSALFVPLAATGWTNRKSRDVRLDVRSNTDRATKNQTRTGDLRCIARCVGRSNCPVYTVRSGHFRSIGRSIARCIAPCKWSLKTSWTQKSCLAESSIRRHLRKNFYESVDNRSLFEVISRISSEQIIRVSTLYRLNSDFRRFLRHSLKDHLHGAMHRAIDRPIDRPMHLICFHTYTIDPLFVQFRLLPQAELTRNRAMTVYTCDQTLIGRPKIKHARAICVARCAGRSNCPVYTVRSGRFRSIGRSIARCIAPCKWALTL